MVVHASETLAAMKKEIALLARVYAEAYKARNTALDAHKWSRADTEAGQMLTFYRAIKSVGGLYATFLKENAAALDKMAADYGEA